MSHYQHLLFAFLLYVACGFGAVLVLAAAALVMGVLFGHRIDAAIAGALPDDEDQPSPRAVYPGCCEMHDAARARIRARLAELYDQQLDTPDMRAWETEMTS